MPEVNWTEAWSIVGRGIGLVFIIMILLATLTHFMGKLVGRYEAAKKAREEAAGGDK